MYNIWCRNAPKFVILVQKCTKSRAVGNLKKISKPKTVLRNYVWTKLTGNRENRSFGSKMEPKILIAPLFVIELHFAIALHFVFAVHFVIPRSSSKPN
jgi:hypothetical protein